MEGIGIVRRIDELGRVVIPKELRKTLQIRNGEQVEIYSSGDKELVIKKYSQLQTLGQEATRYAKILSNIIKKEILICDQTIVIAHEYAEVKYVNALISKTLNTIIDGRTPFKSTSKKQLLKEELVLFEDFYVYPIIVSGDLYGAIVLVGAGGREEIIATACVAECLCTQLE